MNKSLVGLIGSAVLMVIGFCLRLNAASIAWPKSGVSYSGPRADTSWAHTEVAIGQIGMALVATGILLLVFTYSHWLFTKETGK